MSVSSVVSATHTVEHDLQKRHCGSAPKPGRHRLRVNILPQKLGVLQAQTA